MCRKTGLNPQVIIVGRLKAVPVLLFHLFYVRCCSSFKCFNSSTFACPIYLIQ